MDEPRYRIRLTEDGKKFAASLVLDPQIQAAFEEIKRRNRGNELETYNIKKYSIRGLSERIVGFATRVFDYCHTFYNKSR